MGSFDLIVRAPPPASADAGSCQGWWWCPCHAPPEQWSHVTSQPSSQTTSQSQPAMEENKLMTPIIWNIFENWQIGSCEIYLSCKINYWSLIVMLDQARVWTYSENIVPKFSTMNRIFNPVDIMVVNVGGVMIIKFTDLHQIKLIRTGPCRES